MQLAVLVELHVGIVALDSRKVPSVEEAILEAQDGGFCIQGVVDKRVALLVGEMLACKVVRRPAVSDFWVKLICLLSWDGRVAFLASGRPDPGSPLYQRNFFAKSILNPRIAPSSERHSISK